MKITVYVKDKDGKLGLPGVEVFCRDTILITNYDGVAFLNLHKNDSINLYSPGWEVTDTIWTGKSDSIVIYLNEIESVHNVDIEW